MLEANELSYVLNGKKLINNICLAFKPATLYGILGPNGAGKSTFVKTLSGIWTPSSGKVFWNKNNLFKKSRKEISKLISVVPQNPEVRFDYTVWDLVAMGAYSCSTKETTFIEKALRALDAWDLKDRIVTQISHGERKRVYIARALVTQSPILILDEPTSSLDVRHQLQIWNLMLSLAVEGKTVIVTSHDLSLTERFCNQIAVLHQGSCVNQGTYDEVLTENVLKEIFGVMKKEEQFSLY